MERVIKLGEVETRMVANATTPRLYRSLFKRDVFRDLSTSIDGEDIVDYETFENIAFVMAMQGGSVSTGAKIEDWLAAFPAYAIAEAVDQIMELWAGTTATTSDAKKE